MIFNFLKSMRSEIKTKCLVEQGRSQDTFAAHPKEFLNCVHKSTRARTHTQSNISDGLSYEESIINCFLSKTSHTSIKGHTVRHVVWKQYAITMSFFAGDTTSADINNFRYCN